MLTSPSLLAIHDQRQALYSQTLERCVSYFFPDCKLEHSGTSDESQPELRIQAQRDGSLDLSWFDNLYRLHHEQRAFRQEELRLLSAIGTVLSARYRVLFQPNSGAAGMSLFRGLLEDSIVSAYLNPVPFEHVPNSEDFHDPFGDAIETLRISSLSTYESRRISTGVLLHAACDASAGCVVPERPSQAQRFNTNLTAIKSFSRLSNGMDTLALVDAEGFLVDLIDVREWSRKYADLILPAPSPDVFEPHARATTVSGHICLVLTPNGEIKVFSRGTQAFSFINGTWRLSETEERYHIWRTAIGDPALAERIFHTALNLAEIRRGALFVVLNGSDMGDAIVMPADRLSWSNPSPSTGQLNKDQLNYLLRGRHLLELPPALLQTLASLDGAIVLNRDSELIAYGSILRHSIESFSPAVRVEGGRTTAAVSASLHGDVLKVSEDGLISYFRDGRQVWEL